MYSDTLLRVYIVNQYNECITSEYIANILRTNTINNRRYSENFCLFWLDCLIYLSCVWFWLRRQVIGKWLMWRQILNHIHWFDWLLERRPLIGSISQPISWEQLLTHRRLVTTKRYGQLSNTFDGDFRSNLHLIRLYHIHTDKVNPSLFTLGSFTANLEHSNYQINQSESSIWKPGLV